MGFASQRKSQGFFQRFDSNDTISQFLTSWLILAATVLPILLLYDTFTQGVTWVVLVLTLCASGLAIFIAHQIRQGEAAPFFIGLLILCINYYVIAIISIGIETTIQSLWAGICAAIAASGILGIIVTLWIPRHDAGDTDTTFSALEILGVVLLSIAALVVRFYGIDDIPVASNLEATFSLDALATQQIAAINPIAFTFEPVARLYAVVQGWCMYVFGNTIFGSRILSALIGSLTVTMVYLAMRVFIDKRSAWLSALALITLNLHLEYSRVGLNIIADAGLLCAILACFMYGWQTGQRRFYLLAGVCLGLCQYTYQSAKIIPIIFALWLLLLAFHSWDTIEPRKYHLSMMWSVAFVVALPMVWNIALHWNFYYERLVAISMYGVSENHPTPWVDTITAQSTSPKWLVIIMSIRDAAAAFIAVPLRDGYDVGSAMLSVPAAVLFIVGIFLMLREYADPRYWLLFIGLCSAIVLSALTIDTPAAQRLVYITPFVAIIIGIGLAESGRWFRLEWLQSDWSIPTIVTQILSIVLAIGIAGYDGNRYIQLNNNRVDTTNEKSAALISQHIRDYPTGSRIYFFTQPTLSYQESALLAFAAPQVRGLDVYPPLTTAPTWQLNAPMNSFVFTPERFAELALIRQHYPGGDESRLFKENGDTLLIIYDVAGVSPLSTP